MYQMLNKKHFQHRVGKYRARPCVSTEDFSSYSAYVSVSSEVYSNKGSDSQSQSVSASSSNSENRPK